MGEAFTEHGDKILDAKKIFVTLLVLKLQKWFLYQNGVEFKHKSESEVCHSVSLCSLPGASNSRPT